MVCVAGCTLQHCQQGLIASDGGRCNANNNTSLGCLYPRPRQLHHTHVVQVSSIWIGFLDVVDVVEVVDVGEVVEIDEVVEVERYYLMLKCIALFSTYYLIGLSFISF